MVIIDNRVQVVAYEVWKCLHRLAENFLKKDVNLVRFTLHKKWIFVLEEGQYCDLLKLVSESQFNV